MMLHIFSFGLRLEFGLGLGFECVTDHLDLSRCPLLHKSLQPPLQPVLRAVRVVIQPASSGWLQIGLNNTQLVHAVNRSFWCSTWQSA